MGKMFTRPLTEDQKKILEQRKLPSAEQLRAAQDSLFMNLLARVAELESKRKGAKSGG